MFVHLPTKNKLKIEYRTISILNITHYVIYTYFQDNAMQWVFLYLAIHPSHSFAHACTHNENVIYLQPIQEEKGREGTDYKRQNNNAKLC